MSGANYDKATQEAENLIRKYGYEKPIVNVFEIVQKEGLTLRGYKSEKLKDIAGFFDPDTKTIFVNEEDPPNRITYTIAHELGHYILGHTPDKLGVLPRWQKPGIEKADEEKEADVFAANLLVPKHILKKVMDENSLTKDNASTLARMFGVSEEMMSYRLKWV